MTFTPKKPEEMRKLAEEATPGPWALDSHDYDTFIASPVAEVVTARWLGGSQTELGISPEDAAFITAANPAQIIHDADLILSLTKEVEGLREGLQRAEQAMVWANAHIGGQTKYDTAQQVVNCLERFEDDLAAICALSTSGRAET